jgi:hypothetical protein
VNSNWKPETGNIFLLMIMKTVLNELIDHQSLTKANAHQVLIELASGKYNPSQMSSFMTVYMMRNITVEELQGFRDAMLELCIPVRFDQPVMDVCGTGGDGKNTFNISTLSSFVWRLRVSLSPSTATMVCLRLRVIKRIGIFWIQIHE